MSGGWPRPRVVGEGLDFPEGPVYLGGGAVAAVEMRGQRVTRIDPDGATTTLGRLGGGPNGAALGADGAIYVANNGGLAAADDGGYWHAPEPMDGCVQRVAGGAVSTVAADLPGDPPHRPNDLCFGPDGRLYVTDSHNWEDLRNLRPGRIVAIGPGGEVEQVAEMAAMPNGIGFAPDAERMFVAQSLTRKVWAYPWSPAGLGEPEVVCKLPSGSPDGFCFDAEGNLYVCGSVGHVIHVFAPSGKLLRSIDTEPGAQPTNCCIGDGQLFVTYSMPGRVVAYDIDAAPLELFAFNLAGVGGGS
ncbi:SMP-30/gluconolactonase/LRE family protein [Salinactinospora qingdaonensis]|uniref:SMP-30/gluconolactonase/LRE family protein n=1 Tax=Salinactinospora qingdaonensis TaxID=702744 RepID=A0ABP7F5V4_9ACTN